MKEGVIKDKAGSTVYCLARDDKALRIVLNYRQIFPNGYLYITVMYSSHGSRETNLFKKYFGERVHIISRYLYNTDTQKGQIHLYTGVL